MSSKLLCAVRGPAGGMAGLALALAGGCDVGIVTPALPPAAAPGAEGGGSSSAAGGSAAPGSASGLGGPTTGAAAGAGAGATAGASPGTNPDTSPGQNPIAGTPASPDEAKPLPPETPWQKRALYMGRFDFADAKGPRFAWPNSTLTARFTGTSLALVLAEPVPTQYNGLPVNNMYDVVVDQRPAVVVTATPGETSFVIAQDLPAGAHSVRLSKRTEANIGRGQLTGFGLSAGGTLLMPPAPQSRFIEFVSDSVGSGYGAEGNFPRWDGCHFSVAMCNALLAYPAQAAELLKADFHNLAFAGKGLTKNLSPLDPVLTMPVIYSLWDPRDSATAYAFERPAADVVVITIGGNDWSGDGPVHVPPDLDRFVARYLGLIAATRQHSPQSTVFVCATPMVHGQDRQTYLRYLRAVVQQASDTGVRDVRFLEFKEYTENLMFGCDGHPSATGAKQIAQQLAEAVRAARQW